jgi:hypothetical protein
MERLNRTLAFVLMGFMITAVSCGGGNQAEEMVIEGEEAAAPEPVDPAAITAANQLVSRLRAANVSLVPTVRGSADIEYTQPIARREGDFIETSLRIKNVAANAIAGFTVDEFWFDEDGNTVTGDQVRFAQPILVGETRDILLRVPRVSTMDRSNYEFSHQNGDIITSLVEELEDPPEEEEEAEDADDA